ncbi:L-histidine N-alpha-methyltransferase [Methylohalomonas lacus]|uniref:L-histidine N-alpha-methyltransferase n=1 Tax=Methylohalomonas lacus TaxID=398773 RepID=A0AAE3HKU6_9GAMM|nr:L-histidine N(alpha)-methyltransferase [Methylohalomonas lacus]MCS3903078.1 L-histidine N-alpha-methyltransferase [Methylohalomonas lacus]
MANTDPLIKANADVVCQVLKPARPVPDIIEDARNGLLSRPRTLPPKYFYDAHGSDLFERITETREYYPSRTENELLQRHARDIIASSNPDQILELGSGSSRKTQRLFDACVDLGHACNYAPMDVCEDMLLQASQELSGKYDWLAINPIVGDYHAGLDNLPSFTGRRLFVFLGSTIGNFEPAAAQRFINEIEKCMRAGDRLLLGADRVKDPAILEAAYNDNDGVTAAFNLNVLRVLNRELHANFVPDRFRHRAEYNPTHQRIEMRLVSEHEQHVHLGRLEADIKLQSGETILTEVSHKFTPESLQALVTHSGLTLQEHYQADDDYFSLILAHK